jgi:hypothetical protein
MSWSVQAALGWGMLGGRVFCTYGEGLLATAKVVKQYIRFHKAKKRNAEHLKMFPKALPGRAGFYPVPARGRS